MHLATQKGHFKTIIPQIMKGGLQVLREHVFQNLKPPSPSSLSALLRPPPPPLFADVILEQKTTLLTTVYAAF